MGSITLPTDGEVYLDSSSLIYSVERHEPYLGLLTPVWQEAERGQLQLVSSELALAEVLVRPVRERNAVLISRYRDVFASADVRLVPALRQTWEDAARLRADHGLRTPDALHAATALQEHCDLFITNDTDFRRVTELPVVVLRDVLAKPD